MDPKPLAAAESRDPKSIRFCPAEWSAFTVAARVRGLEPSPFVRDLALMGLMIVETPVLMEAHLKALAVIRPSLQSTHA